jgi:hypothetical protein
MGLKDQTVYLPVCNAHWHGKELAVFLVVFFVNK